MAVYNLGNVTPELPNDDEYWIAPTATVIGDVILKPGATYKHTMVHKFSAE